MVLTTLGPSVRLAFSEELNIGCYEYAAGLMATCLRQKGGKVHVLSVFALSSYNSLIKLTSAGNFFIHGHPSGLVCGSVVGHISSMHKALGFIPSIPPSKRKKPFSVWSCRSLEGPPPRLFVSVVPSAPMHICHT